MTTDLPIDLDNVAAAMVEAKKRSDALPYKVDFEIDAEHHVLIVRGIQRMGGGMWINGSTTGRPLSVVMSNPQEAFDYVFGFLEASFRST